MSKTKSKKDITPFEKISIETLPKDKRDRLRANIKIIKETQKNLFIKIYGSLIMAYPTKAKKYFDKLVDIVVDPA